MLPISKLKKLGLYIDEHFLDNDICNQLRHEMAESEKTTGNVYSQVTKREYQDRALRKTQTCTVNKESQTLVEEKILDIKADLETFFNDSYSHLWEKPKFLEYKTGDYFLPHTDDQVHRQLNISIYLNSQSEEPNSHQYSGGELIIYNLIKSPGWQGRGISIPGQQGLLVAYPVQLVHEVTAITAGQRYAIVSRFLDKGIEKR